MTTATTTLPEALYRAQQVRELDGIAMEEFGMAAATLMERAGRYAFDVLRARWPRATRLTILCGPGNNGGDGYVIARLAQDGGYEPTVMVLGPRPKPGSAAAAARAAYEATGPAVETFDATRLGQADVVVDALLGTGLERELLAEWRAAVEAVNATARPVLAIDIPTGLHADSGRVMGAAVRAQATASFIGLKSGLCTGEGPAHAGHLYFHDLDVPAAVYGQVTPFAWRLTEASLQSLLPRRTRTAHKGDFGHVLVIGGAAGMPGAARLAGEAACRVGAGLVTLATHTSHCATINLARPELIAHGVKGSAALKPLLARATVIALGPGLGRAAWGKAMFTSALASDVPLVLDADALFFLAGSRKRRPDWVLSPHPGEAGRLLGITGSAVQGDRFAAARAITTRYGGVCVLKGAGTVIAAGNEAFEVCDRGNPGMASGGTGDVLTGVIAALRAQGLEPWDAARLGVWAHAVAGDRAAARDGEIGLLAGDLLPGIRTELNRLAYEVA